MLDNAISQICQMIDVLGISWDERRVVKSQNVQVNSVFAEYHGDTVSTRITVWESGLCDAEIISPDGDTLYYLHIESLFDRDMRAVFSEYIALLLNGGIS
jgi:hypothetical protein